MNQSQKNSLMKKMKGYWVRMIKNCRKIFGIKKSFHEFRPRLAMHVWHSGEHFINFLTDFFMFVIFFALSSYNLYLNITLIHINKHNMFYLESFISVIFGHNFPNILSQLKICFTNTSPRLRPAAT